MAKAGESIENRLWSGMAAGFGGCIVWTRSVNPKSGHGQIEHNGKNRKPHVVAWEIFNGPVAPGLQLNHRCNNPRCCNHHHLYVGTQADNIRDIWASGNDVRGEKTGTAKLTEAQVLEIRSNTTLTQKALGEKYGVSRSSVQFIKKGVNWGWL